MGEVISYLTPLNKSKLEKLQVVAILMALRRNLRLFTDRAKKDKTLEALAIRYEELANIHSAQLNDENLSRGVKQIYFNEIMYIASLMLEERSPEIA